MPPSAHTSDLSTPHDRFAEPGTPACSINYAAFDAIRRIVNDKPRVARGACSCFANHLMLHFPEIAERIDEADYGELHLEMGELKLATREAITEGDWRSVCEQFAFVAQLLNDDIAEVNDAISVSYLGALFYGELSPNHAEARCLLPQRLAIALEDVERHYDDLVP
jgi:hypothetical protein